MIRWFLAIFGIDYDDTLSGYGYGEYGGNGSFHMTERTRIGRSRFYRVRHRRTPSTPRTVLVALRFPGTPEQARAALNALPINAYDGYAVAQIEVPTVARAHWQAPLENGPAEVRVHW